MYRTNILEYLESSAERFSNKIAFSDGMRELSFSDLCEKAKRVGSYLVGRGYCRECIAIAMKKSVNAISAMLGVVYAGCYYVIIDAEMGEQRVNEILNKLRPRAVICEDEMSESDAENSCVTRDFALFKNLPCSIRKYIFSEVEACPIDNYTLSSVREKQIDIDPVYVVFTSGSSGEPKGVVASHASVIDYTETICEALGFDFDTRFANQSPLYFDAPLKEIMPTLKLGASVFFVPREHFLFPIKLCEFLNTHRINTVCWVSSALSFLSRSGALEANKPEFLKKICFGSEVMSIAEYKKWRDAYPDAAFVNLYGPTEATGMSCYWIAKRELSENEPIPIGKPFRNTEILLVCGNRRASKGECGEICIRGRGVTLGYFGDREQSNLAFVQNPILDTYHDRVYRTGDVGRYNEYGELCFVSRLDRVVKRQGFKVSLDEIESAAEGCDGIARAAAIYDESERKILLYYTGVEQGDKLVRNLRARLSRQSAPDRCIHLEIMPQTANGKKDRRALIFASKGGEDK